MINQDKWINSLPKQNAKYEEKINQIDHYRWVDTISQKNTYSVVGKYSLMAVLFIFGLLFVSVVKNETRNLEKEINNLKASNDIIKFNLDQAILDNEVITSPKNITKLAKEYLNTDLISYKKSQIKKLGEDSEPVAKLNKKNNNLSSKIKLSIKKKKKELKKLQEIYSNPKSIPVEIKKEVAKKIEKKKVELKDLYNTSPKEILTYDRIHRWAVVQVAKLFLGIPVIPGR
tara:strand:+ start:96 stop:785 length:690 start_codon:yes stop_codon:yes gene_type:complete